MTGAPDGIMLPKAAGGADVTLLDAKLSVREALHGIDDGATRIVVLATETRGVDLHARQLSRRERAPRRPDLGRGGSRAPIRRAAERAPTATGPSRSAWCEASRSSPPRPPALQAIDAVYADFRDLEGLKRECAAARRDGFTGKLAIHPDQVEPINEAFTPSAEAIARRRARRRRLRRGGRRRRHLARRQDARHPAPEGRGAAPRAAASDFRH